MKHDRLPHCGAGDWFCAKGDDESGAAVLLAALALISLALVALAGFVLALLATLLAALVAALLLTTLLVLLLLLLVGVLLTLITLALLAALTLIPLVALVLVPHGASTPFKRNDLASTPCRRRGNTKVLIVAGAGIRAVLIVSAEGARLNRRHAAAGRFRSSDTRRRGRAGRSRI
jgi:hypothetical protein